MNISKQKIFNYSFMIVFLAAVANQVNATSQQEKQREGLKMISEMAVDICDQIPIEGQGKDVELSGNANAKLKGLLGKLADIGIGAAGKYNKSKYQGLLRKDLAEALKSARDCRLAVFRELKDKIIDNGGVLTHPPPPLDYSHNGTYMGMSTEGFVQSPYKTIVTRNGNRVTGNYYLEGEVGTIEGIIEGNTLYYNWQLAGLFGKGVSVEENGRTRGVWGYGNSTNNGGTAVSQKQ